jgi:von Hippel-Lindau disease tumor supressor
VFYVVALISLVQLLICCFAEYKRLKQPSFLKAFRITTQKFLYFVVFIASLLRAAYFCFTQPESAQPAWTYYLMSAYYPLLMTCASLIVCFWAETFHLRDIRYERQFLSKSLLGFLAFNLLPYSLFGAEVSIKFFTISI